MCLSPLSLCTVVCNNINLMVCFLGYNFVSFIFGFLDFSQSVAGHLKKSWTCGFLSRRSGPQNGAENFYSHRIRQELTCCRTVSEFKLSFKDKQQYIFLIVKGT